MDGETDRGDRPYLSDTEYRSRRNYSSGGRRRAPSRPGREKGRPRKRVWLPLLVLVFLSPAIFSWAKYVSRPSSLPIWPNSVEWVREHHGNWLVDEVEKYNALWFHQPQKGGPGLTTLPSVGLPNSAPQPKHTKRCHQAQNRSARKHCRQARR